MHNEQINQARVFIYNILAMLFVESHVEHNADKIVQNLEVLSENSFDDEVEEAVKCLLEYIQAEGVKSLYENFQKLFLVPFGEYVSLSCSQYHEQREAGLMLIKVRDILAKTKIRKDETLFKAQEDDFGFLFTLSAYLIEQQQINEIKEDLQKQLFLEVINPYIDHLSMELEKSKNPIYIHASTILANFIQFERSYLKIIKAA
ncbi:TorD/DmsD family molecular chaperone [Candidatus Marinarcus aquaticus]|uniref:Uncharacterized protein n=1 Tax=Candidatus Marinarcus aquaticus TaxID=2044504 RepID=A0A4Q0XUF4_9BACT|nr:molecular chaperone TorD family protein [Candidatus Marinarcus aquaticus]RXJ60783.1 hypothetical protein CRV04_01855 [Candidatus Marinarcus aquaticus]